MCRRLGKTAHGIRLADVSITDASHKHTRTQGHTHKTHTRGTSLFIELTLCAH